MRVTTAKSLGLALLWLLALPLIAWAAPSGAEIIEKAVGALRSTCYEARASLLDQLDYGKQRTVHIYHVAPDLFCVKPLVNGAVGYEEYIENGAELVRLNRKEETLVRMPLRQFSINDAMTTKFLRELGKHQGTTVLDGMVGEYAVYALRQDVTKDKPYTITVGVDKRNYFPLFLLVTDYAGATRVYYEVKSIIYLTSEQISDEYFQIPVYGDKQMSKAPRAAGALPNQAALSTMAGGGQPLPLYPSYLPKGYVLEALSLVNYDNPGNGPALVYHFEIYGPHLSDLLSVFQTQSTSLNLSGMGQSGEGFFMTEHDSWIIAVLCSSLGLGDLSRVANGLKQNDAQVRQLLDQTAARDSLLSQAANVTP